MVCIPFLPLVAKWGDLSKSTPRKEFVTNFPASERPAWEKGIADLNLGQVLVIEDNAVDFMGRPLPDYLALYSVVYELYAGYLFDYVKTVT